MFNRILPRLLLFVVIALNAAAAEQFNTDDFFYAIRARESRNRYHCPTGKHGERGAYQFRYVVWRRYTNAPFENACTLFADDVAEKHLDWLASTLTAAGVEPNAWNLAAAWNCGASKVVAGHIPRQTVEYADAVVSIIESKGAERAAFKKQFQLAMSN